MDKTARLAAMKLLLLALILPLGLGSCASMGPNDGLVPRMSAQANLPYSVNVMPTGALMAAPSGGMVNPLNETRKAYWSTP